MRLKGAPQPMVFRFDGPTALCGAVEGIYRLTPGAASRLCRWRGRYFLRVEAGLAQRQQLARAAEPYGKCLGASPVLYAYCQEHGQEISRDPVAKLGQALTTQRHGPDYTEE